MAYRGKSGPLALLSRLDTDWGRGARDRLFASVTPLTEAPAGTNRNPGLLCSESQTIERAGTFDASVEPGSFESNNEDSGNYPIG